MLKKQSSLLDFFRKPQGKKTSQNSTENNFQKEKGDTIAAKVEETSPKENDVKQEFTELKRLKKNPEELSPQTKENKTSFPSQENIKMEEELTAEKKKVTHQEKATSITKQRTLDMKSFVDTSKVGKSTTKKQGTKTKTPVTPVATPKKEEGDVLIDIEKHEGNAFDYDDFIVKTPVWALKENARDANGRSRNDPNYDPTTLYVPPEEFKNFTPTMKQYWQIKSQNNDKILMFKLGKFYELFYEDALLCHKELDLNWMANKMHVGFPEGALDNFACILINKGYKVCVVEQTETPKQLEERLKKKPSASKDEKTIKRELVQVMSKGTYIDPNDPSHEPRILLSLRNKNLLITVAFLDIGYNKISFGHFNDDENYTMFKTFVSQIRPTEVVYETLEIDKNLINILKNCSSQPVLSPLNDGKAWTDLQAYGDFERFYGPHDEWPDNLIDITNYEELYKDQTMICLAGMLTYLSKMLILDNVISTARYEVYDFHNYEQSRMTLDSQALQHLEILEVEYSTRNITEGSLLSYVDKTVSKFGKRLMRKWVCTPLLDINSINDRLNAVEDLEKHYELRTKFHNQLKLLPDLERACGRIYKQSVKKNEHVVMFEDVTTSKLKEFKKLMDNFKKAREILTIFENVDFGSKTLQGLTMLEDYNLILEGKSRGMPDILPLVEEISDFVRWQGSQEQLGPKPGVDNDYDEAQAEIQAIQKELEDYLKGIQVKLGDRSICYVHTKKRYEIEVPAEVVAGNKKPKEFEFSSKKQNKERFITAKTQELVKKLEEVEERVKQILNIFVFFLFNFFFTRHKVWDRFIEGLAQLDCLCSLSLTSFVSDGLMCRPQLYPADGKIFFEAINLRHPCVSLRKPNFIPNDIRIGDVDVENSDRLDPRVILLTGPNMGGKSTILRQACVGAILAQIGCYVPASSCHLSIVDRVFTRIGASDRLIEGKSTFYIEMEETLNVLKYGTQNSLVIMDELGRGTSTYDGLALAYSVLKWITQKIGCRTLFATHYHVLLDEFRDDSSVRFYHMAAKLPSHGEVEKIVFLYKLIEGECSNSFGLNIARVSGFPEATLKIARAKALEFEKEFSLRENVKANKIVTRALEILENTLQSEESDIDFVLTSLTELLRKNR